MSGKILQINYKLNGPRAEYEKENLPYAQPIADIPGLRWKVWIINEAQSEAGGIYLFDVDTAVQTFLDGPIIAARFLCPRGFVLLAGRLSHAMESHSRGIPSPFGFRRRQQWVIHATFAMSAAGQVCARLRTSRPVG